MTMKIYALHDGDGAVRYIGKTRRSLPCRLAGHLQDSRAGKTSKKSQWIRGLLDIGRFPQIILIGEAQHNGNREEKAWIAYGLSAGWELTNATGGGGGDQRESICHSVCLYIDTDVLRELKIRAELRGTSISKEANASLRDKLGLPPEDGFKGKDKL